MLLCSTRGRNYDITAKKFENLSRVARSVLGEIFLIFILVSRIVCGWVPFFNFFLSVGSVIPSYVVLKRDSLLSIRKTKRKHNVIA